MNFLYKIKFKSDLTTSPIIRRRVPLNENTVAVHLLDCSTEGAEVGFVEDVFAPGWLIN